MVAGAGLQSTREPEAVILAVIPPGTTRKTVGDQADGTADVTCEEGTFHHLTDDGEPTHDRLATAAG